MTKVQILSMTTYLVAVTVVLGLASVVVAVLVTETVVVLVCVVTYGRRR